jgi:hypothetical protein
MSKSAKLQRVIANGYEPVMVVGSFDTAPPTAATGSIVASTKADLVASAKATGALVAVAVADLGGTKAEATITCIAQADMVDGQTLTLIDAEGTEVVFEFDVNGTGVAYPHVQVDISGETTDAEVAIVLAAAINGSVLEITATPATADVELVQNIRGVEGNTIVSETVADTDFIVTNFTGGQAIETFTLIDAAATTLVFEFDLYGDGVTDGRVAVDVSGETTDAEVAAVMRTAINGAAILITASGADENVVLTQDLKGTAGNTTVTETVANVGFTKTNFTGGANEETFTLIDASATTVVFAFDILGDGANTGKVAVDVSAATTAVEVADAMRTAINAAEIDITASGETSTVVLTQDDPGAAGNTTITETVVHASFTKTNFTGGATNDVDASTYKGKGWTVSRIDLTNVYRVTFTGVYPAVLCAFADLQLATPADKFAVIKALSATTMDIAVWDISDAATAQVSETSGNRINFCVLFKNSSL